MRLSVLLAVVVSVSALPATASGPLDPPPAIVVVGKSSATTTFTVSARTEFRYSDTKATYSGRYAAVMIEHTKGRSEGGVFFSADFNTEPPTPATTAPPTIFGANTHTLAPGTYRAYLLTDAEATVTIPLTAGNAVTVKPTKRVRAIYGATEASVAPGSVSFSLRLPLGLTNDRTKTNVVAQYVSPAAPGLQLTACVTAKGKTCETAYAKVINNNAGLWATKSGIGNRRRYPTAADARSEATVTTTAGGTATLVTLQHDGL